MASMSAAFTRMRSSENLPPKRAIWCVYLQSATHARATQQHGPAAPAHQLSPAPSPPAPHLPGQMVATQLAADR
jgi:hypothetical protein